MATNLAPKNIDGSEEIEVLKRENELLMAQRKENEENEFKYGNDTGSADWAQRLQIAVDVVKEDVSCVMTRVMGSFGYLDPE
ncbi:hypothetical protein QJS10_CPA06g00886 [Acorus calamus]|uniref:Uncharacterized protein n=1 Tax=Acorus calamus TaxID=4465 RepID=A0AAV9EQL4_ACOCL|nr:hypothetical protein QJS10_CPA06g00886 [Acorus calamus]